MQTIRLESDEALVIRSGIQSGEFPQAACSSKNNEALVASQPPRETNRNRGEDCQAQQIRNIPNG